MEKELVITLKGGDGVDTLDLTTKQGSLFIDGKNLGLTPLKYCYIPVFRS